MVCVASGNCTEVYAVLAVVVVTQGATLQITLEYCAITPDPGARLRFS